MRVEIKIPGREELCLEIEVDASGQILSSSLIGLGDLHFLKSLQIWRKNLVGALDELKMPDGNSAFALMMREALLKIKGQWQNPFTDQELCHCRAVPLAKVEAAIFAGAHTPEKVSRWTSASTSCGTCRPDVEAILKYRLVG